MSSSSLLFPQRFGRYVHRTCLSNSGTFTELRTTSFIESAGVACSDYRVQVLSIPVLLLACSQDWTCNLQMIVSLEALGTNAYIRYAMCPARQHASSQKFRQLIPLNIVLISIFGPDSKIHKRGVVKIIENEVFFLFFFYFILTFKIHMKMEAKCMIVTNQAMSMITIRHLGR